MKKFVAGIIVGILLTVGLQYGWRYYQYSKVKDDVALFSLAKQDIERKLTGTRVLDVNVSPNSKVFVNYVHDKLYNVNGNYERDGKIKNITTQYGTAQGTWITPHVAELELLDKNAGTMNEGIRGQRFYNFDKLFTKWEQDINDQLKKGRSGVYGNPVFIEEIGKQAHLHEDVLFQKLKTNMFVYELLDASNQLLTKYNMIPFKGGSVKVSNKSGWMHIRRKYNLALDYDVPESARQRRVQLQIATETI